MECFGALFEYFGTVFAKTDSFFSKIDQNEAVFDNFEKDTVVFALICEASTFAPKYKDLWLNFPLQISSR